MDSAALGTSRGERWHQTGTISCATCPQRLDKRRAGGGLLFLNGSGARRLPTLPTSPTRFFVFVIFAETLESLVAVELWDELSSNPDAIPVTEEQLNELDRRFEEYRHDPDKVVTWEEAKARILSGRR